MSTTPPPGSGTNTPRISIKIHDHERSSSAERPLRFFRSPVEEHMQYQNFMSSSSINLAERARKPEPSHSRFESRDTSYTAIPSLYQEGGDSDSESVAKLTPYHAVHERKVSTSGASQISSHPQPAFHRHAEATPSELFFDLWFVANLATYTNQNKVNNLAGLANYIGFFCILWFTWCQVALFDVRLGRDSVFDRLCKAGQFGVMAGFSFVAYYFDPAGAKAVGGEKGFVDGKSLSLILMGSRFILFLQYLASLYWLRRFRDLQLPLAIIAGSCFISGFIFLGISFMFETDGSKNGASNAYIAWYVVSIVETIINITISCVWRNLSFKGTHLVERMSLLTLIVLGEGILALSKAITTVWGNTYYYPGLGAAVAASILMVYCLFQLYFDTIAEEHFGTIRMQIWAFLHFPLHLGIVLFDEGAKQFVVWNTAIKQQLDYTRLIEAIPIYQQVIANREAEFTGDSNSTDFFHSQATALWDSFETFIHSKDGLGVPYSANQTALVDYTSTISDGVNQSSESIVEAVYGFWSTMVNGIFDNFLIEGPKPVPTELTTKADKLIDEANAPFMLYDMVFTYFYATTGIVVVLMLALWILSKRDKNTWFDYVRFGVWFVIGTTIACTALLDLSAEHANGPGFDFINGPWVLPAPAILLVVLVVVFNLPFGGRRAKRAYG